MPSHSTRSEQYQVKLSHYAIDTYKQAKDNAFDQNGKIKKGNRWVTVFSSYDHIIRNVISEHATNPKFMLGKRGNVNFHGIFRHKAGRARLFWIASEKKRVAIVLFIGETRKQGDRKDPYQMLEKYLRTGVFDHHFEELGQCNPLK